jgi:GTPase SAR1 family protein/ribosomal protein L12E/L44/L45/RPP1/RPP2
MIKDTIFSPSFGNRPAQLVGREKLLSSILDGLDQKPGSRERAVVILGQRGSGKTVLLWELADRAAEKNYVVARPTVVSEGMLQRIIEKIQDDASRFVKPKDAKARLSGGNVGVLGFSAGVQFSRSDEQEKSFHYQLTTLARELTKQGKGILILIDELQANSSDIRQLVIAYQEIVGEGLNIALVMAGLPGAVSATLNDKVLTFLNRARKEQLVSLAISEVDAYFMQAFAQLGLHVSNDIRTRAAKATHGSPYLLQLIGHNMVLYASDKGEVSEQTLKSAVDLAQQDFENDVCRTTLAALSDKDISFLVAMSSDSEESAMSDIAKRMGVTPDYAQKYRRRLIEAGVIEAFGRGRVRFAVPYLSSYLQEN